MAREDTSTKYAECIVDWLGELGYTHCFFVAGGNIMHLLDAARTRMQCIPFVHEVAAGIAAEYFNESEGQGRAFALVTAGPGLTNIMTAMAGAYLESRELLVVGGQVKSTDLAGPTLRQRGIQEIDGVSLVEPVTVSSVRIEAPIAREQFLEVVLRGTDGRPGPVFVEVCLDVQGAPVATEPRRGQVDESHEGTGRVAALAAAERAVPLIDTMMQEAERPVWLIGGGVSRATADEVRDVLGACAVPLMTTWNGADRIGADEEYYFGRPNTWGQRYANVLLQQADLVVAFGTRLGIQQTGFNWQAFAPKARVVQFDIDTSELEKGHPTVDVAVAGDANAALLALAARAYRGYEEWVSFCRNVKELLPLSEAANETGPGFVSPYDFYL